MSPTAANAGYPPLEEHERKKFLVMEYVEVETLASRLKRGRLPVDEVLPVAIRIAEALEAAHDKGIIHRDLMAGNLGVTPDGKFKVLDFDLARSADERSRIGVSHLNG